MLERTQMDPVFFETKDTAQVTSKQLKGSRNKVKQGNLPNNKLTLYQAN